MTSTPTAPRNLREYTLHRLDDLQSEVDRDGVSPEEALVGACNEILEDLDQAPELQWIDLSVASGKHHPAMMAHAWAVDKYDRLHLATVITRDGINQASLPYVLSRKEISDVAQRMVNLAEHLRNGRKLDAEVDPEIGMFAQAARQILVAPADHSNDDPEIVLHVITLCQYRGVIPRPSAENLIVSTELRDVAWFWKSSMDSTDEQIDFRHLPGGGLACVVASQDASGEPEVLLASFPGVTLAELYDRHHDALLRRNVRIYLRQTRKVNREMAQSARTSPQQFIALNNGISAVAASVNLSDDGTRIITLNDLQIVNGGQTTATLHEVWRDTKNPADLTSLRVQAKITIIPETAEHADELATNIAIAANSQNRIAASDLLSGDPRERSLEKLSRTLRYKSQGAETGWFYERVRGQHAGHLAASSGEGRDGVKVYPPDQVITKSYAAQLLMAWDQKPHLSSLGGEKALTRYKDGLPRNSDGSLPEATSNDFNQLVALAVIRREAEGSIAAQGSMKPPLGFYLLAWLSKNYHSEINLPQIARTGVLPERLLKIIQDITPLISIVMRSQPADVPHESERPKKDRCWTAVQTVRLPQVTGSTVQREYTRQDWQAALLWVENKKLKALKEQILRAKKIVQTGKASTQKDFLNRVMQEAIERGFKIDLKKLPT